MELPDYFIKAMTARYRRIVENSRYDPKDTRTANAMRVAKDDLRRLQKYICANDD